MCNIVKTHLESKSQHAWKYLIGTFDCVQYSKNTFRKQITTEDLETEIENLLCAI